MVSEERVEALLRQLSLAEKCALLAGKDLWRTVPVERLGIQSIVMTDGPHGVRATEEGERTYSPATSFPTGVSMAATWDPALIERVGEALADETHALGCDILLGPCVNIMRHPTAGRNFEAYSEDPYLAGKIGAAWVKGLQRKGVGASLKHYAANNQEDDRSRGSSEVDERTLREIYLAQFEMVVKEANPWTVMCSYNRINGVYASQQNHLLNEILKDEWGYDGAVISDWGANHTIFSSVAGGLDLEMPGPVKYYGRLLEEAVQNWQIEIEQVDEAVRRVLRLLLRAGGIERARRPAGSLNTPQHQALAKQVALEAITLLKNEGAILPLDEQKVKKVAVIGPMAAEGAIGGGGSSFLRSPYTVSPLEALQARLGGSANLVYAQGCEAYTRLPVMDPKFVQSQDGQPGFDGAYYAGMEFIGPAQIERVDARIDHWFMSFAPLETTPETFSVRWTGKLSALQNGRHTLKVQNTGLARLYLDGKLVLENGSLESSFFWSGPEAQHELVMQTGQPHELKVEFIRPKGVIVPSLRVSFGYTPSPAEDHRLKQAVIAAKAADVAVVFAGWPEGHESEGFDRPGIGLTNRQDELIAAVAAANPRTVVVLNCGSPVAMPWADQVMGIVEAYYPGQENGNAVADILLGAANPSGKLTVTFPQRIQDTPAYLNFGPGRQVLYGEGVFVGYRHYDQRALAPLFPFGHGLSYTTFTYRDLKVEAGVDAAGAPQVKVSLSVENTGSRAGAEVVQLYVSDPAASLPRPPKELKGFARVELKPGESKLVAFTLDRRAFAFYDVLKKDWVVEPGVFGILAGASSRDIRLSAEVTL